MFKKADVNLHDYFVIRQGNRLVVVQVLQFVKDRWTGHQHYEVRNLRTGRIKTVKSAQKFRKRVDEQAARDYMVRVHKSQMKGANDARK